MLEAVWAPVEPPSLVSTVEGIISPLSAPLSLLCTSEPGLYPSRLKCHITRQQQHVRFSSPRFYQTRFYSSVYVWQKSLWFIRNKMNFWVPQLPGYLGAWRTKGMFYTLITKWKMLFRAYMGCGDVFLPFYLLCCRKISTQTSLWLCLFAFYFYFFILVYVCSCCTSGTHNLSPN